MQTTIHIESPDSAEAIALIDELEAILSPMYPDESRHGYSVEKLLAKSVSFFVIRVDGFPAGCCGIEFFAEDYGEVKRMYLRPQFRGKGLARLMLDHLCDFAQQKGIGLLRLETGVYQKEAISLYQQYGFQPIPPFGEYRADPLSLYLEFRIT